ncbi:hypothetical protein KK103_11810 [Curtobacterium flaccumfaciens pv. flaccumfaciens]|uniref:Uncharacterized protein n=1 Tax=Curtobacterium flaccumfaciens pv. flaccumfaciens TaxID=138532 RepID=A0A9Q2W564_9MICO|nr:hypothetical protein [Curtobacterium flaccumfaciens]MBT1542450.1 hypothetical protein [Curtobacterium flaccumfaciens pv. flaccumfaciens]
MTIDLTESIAPKSDQLDALDLLSGPRTFTIERVTANNAEQPFNFHLREFPRVWRPGLSMRRVMVKAWGPNADNYIGKRVTLYCDETVRFGNDVTGGTRISHMSGIEKKLSIPLLIKRGKSALFTVQPLPDAAPTRNWLGELQLAGSNATAIGQLGQAAQNAGAPANVIAAIRTAFNAAQAGGVE